MLVMGGDWHADTVLETLQTSRSPLFGHRSSESGTVCLTLHLCRTHHVNAVDYFALQNPNRTRDQNQYWHNAQNNTFFSHIAGE